MTNLVTQLVSLTNAAQPGSPYGVGNLEQTNGVTFTAVAAPGSSGRVKRMDRDGNVLETWALAASQSMSWGPFPTIRKWRIEVDAGSISFSLDRPDTDFATALGNVESFVGNRTLSASDNGKLLRCDDTSAVTVTVPANLPTGINIGFAQYGSGGSITVAGATNRSGKTALSAQYAEGSLIVWRNVDGQSAEFALGGAFA